MITKPELARAAAKKGYRIEAIESDYLQDIALMNVAKEFGRKLAFKGGTCLYKLYELNRFSEDLDFTAAKGFRPKNFFQRLPYFFRLLDLNSGVRVETHQRAINVYQEINGPLYDGRKETQTVLRFNVSLRERILLPTHTFPYTPPYTGLNQFDLCVMHEKEILAEKVRAIYQRRKARDVYDLWYLLKTKGVALDRKLAEAKLARDKIKFDSSQLLKRIEENKASWESDLASLVADPLPPFEQVQKEITRLL